MKIVINVPDYVKEQADYGKGEELGIPLWLAYEIANGTPLPKGHGRLIDERDLIPDSDYEDGMFYAVSIGAINGAPTIIEADKGESEDTE